MPQALRLRSVTGGAGGKITDAINRVSTLALVQTRLIASLFMLNAPSPIPFITLPT
ncbi:hypothetical protein [Nostoc sp. UHCC 0302]|uniref:hypothetical protein n=1 Tax=Nostoc sp. UHCC 0302 TaxID=3134896 RepID=UPI00311CA1DB